MHRLPPHRRLPTAWLEREAFPVSVFALYAVFLALAGPQEIVQDSWLALVSGRAIWAHGLPAHETLTVLAHGATWVDQQWLAQLAFFAIDRIGGLGFVLLVHVLLLAAAFGLALAAARWRGGSPASVFWVAVASIFLTPWSWQLRTQSFAYVLYVAVFWLLVADCRKPGRRVLLVVPLLALWANLHGSVLLGAALVFLRAISFAIAELRSAQRGRRWGVNALALGAAPLAIFVSPYGPVALAGYYKHMLGGAALSHFVVEWGPTSVPAGWPFFLLAATAIWLVGRHSRVLQPFEQAALCLTGIAALLAIRNVVWFGLTLLILIPALVDEHWHTLRRRSIKRGPAAWLGRLSPLLLLAVPAVLLARQPVPAQRWPTGAARAVASAVNRDTTLRVFASDALADWLLWVNPGIVGKVAYDARFELLTRTQLQALVDFHRQAGLQWRRASDGFHLLVLDHDQDAEAEGALLRGGATVLYRSPQAVVLITRALARPGGPTVTGARGMAAPASG